MANTLVNDLLQNVISNPTDKKLLIWNKSLVVILGLVVIGCSYATLFLPGGIIEVANSLTNMVAGPSFGIFCLGFFIPFSDHISALFGLLTGFGLCVWLYIGRIFNDTPTEIALKNMPKETSTEACMYQNGTVYPPQSPPESIEVENSGLLSFYNISYFYIGFVGFITCYVAGKTSGLCSSYA